MLHIPPMMLVFVVLFAVIAGAVALLSWARNPRPRGHEAATSPHTYWNDGWNGL